MVNYIDGPEISAMLLDRVTTAVTSTSIHVLVRASTVSN